MKTLDTDTYPDTLKVIVGDGDVILRGRSSDIEMHPEMARVLAARLLDAVLDIRDCGHDHMDGVDGVDIADPDKVWRCRCCGWEGTQP